MNDIGGVREILIATGNPGKYREIAQVLGHCGSLSMAPASAEVSRREIPCANEITVRWKSLKNLPVAIPEPEEDGHTFAENAALKAHYYARASGLWTLADDSGLEVDCLDGAPGVLSARYAGLPENTPRSQIDPANNRKLIENLRGIPLERRVARFRCALALSDGERILATAEGAVEGYIIDEASGANGFGYDPYFYLPDRNKTMAEMSAEEKNRISHRGQALEQMKIQLDRLLTV